MKNSIRNVLLSLAIGVSATPAWAKLLNAGIWVSNQNVSPGKEVQLATSIYSDTVQSGVTVTVGLHKYENGVLAASPAFFASYPSQGFTKDQRLSYNIKYIIPSTLQNGVYVLVMKAGTAVHRSEYLLAGSPSTYPMTVSGAGTVVSPTSTPVATPTSQPVPREPASVVSATEGLSNSGVYIPTKTVNAGAAIEIHNSFLATKAISGVNIRMEVLSASNPSAAAVASQSFSGVSFASGENKVYVLKYTLPSSLASGTYFLAVKASNSAGQYYVNVTSNGGYNGFTVVGATGGSVSPSPTPAPTPSPVPATGSYLRGINIMDPGIGPHTNPGVFNTHYTTPTLEALKLLKGRGLGVIRLPIMWERIQKSLGGSLDSEYQGLILQTLRDANTAGLKIIVDLHNYGRYTANGVERTFGEAGGPTQAQYADVWSKLAKVIKADASAYAATYAYDIMNEPHDLPTANGVPGNKIWEQYAQAAVSAIRANGDTKLIHVEGYSWASPLYFSALHPAKFINDPANNIMYHAHLYMDDNAGGAYNNSFAFETQKAKEQGHASVAARGIYRLKKFTDWCAAQQVRCFVGEYGWPNSAVVGASEANLWNQAGEQLLQFMDSVRIGATMWATGSWLSPSGNIMNAYTLPGRSSYSFAPLSQTPVLEAHPGK